MSNDPTGVGPQDPRVAELRTAVTRLRRELAGYRGHLPDREIAEEELTALDGQTATGVPAGDRLRYSLLLITGALGSVSALAPALREVRNAIDLFGPLSPHPTVPPWRVSP
ncbi:DUF5955 family protein [Streptantibioticus ferralitis]|uniref:DUF5955 family protein n=1 Tax=Streptantibioticus ferralitis TaxID=236510 RepID=A0ABT5Z4E7_9ACTN|nr:DUF5955 family protein [Streptantibioticus ferralitis]MDF2258628.1 DUF5955 family protein [Streptantibioticus ferralitis]